MTGAARYSPADYDAMYADGVRTPAYLAAIAKAVTPGDVVVEIGTGLGYFAIAAARAGARHVYTIEREASVELAEELVRENGFADRITCIRGDASVVTLPERGSLLLSDLRGTLPLFGNAIPTIVSARDRLVEPGARMIPARDTIRCAPCTAPSRWQATEIALSESAGPIVRSAATRIARSSPRRDKFAAADLVADPVEIASFDYATIRSPDVTAALSWSIDHDARVEGLALWFDADLGSGITFSTAPGGPRTVYGQLFLPLEHGIEVGRGHRLDCSLRARLVDGEYVFAWRTTWFDARGAAQGTWSQSSLGALLASPAELARRKGSFVPPAELGARLLSLARLADGERSLAEIAANLRHSTPGKFTSDAAALAWVVSVLAAGEAG